MGKYDINAKLNENQTLSVLDLAKDIVMDYRSYLEPQAIYRCFYKSRKKPGLIERMDRAGIHISAELESADKEEQFKALKLLKLFYLIENGPYAEQGIHITDIIINKTYSGLWNQAVAGKEFSNWLEREYISLFKQIRGPDEIVPLFYLIHLEWYRLMETLLRIAISTVKEDDQVRVAFKLHYARERLCAFLEDYNLPSVGNGESDVLQMGFKQLTVYMLGEVNSEWRKIALSISEDQDFIEDQMIRFYQRALCKRRQDIVPWHKLYFIDKVSGCEHNEEDKIGMFSRLFGETFQEQSKADTSRIMTTLRNGFSRLNPVIHHIKRNDVFDLDQGIPVLMLAGIAVTLSEFGGINNEIKYDCFSNYLCVTSSLEELKMCPFIYKTVLLTLLLRMVINMLRISGEEKIAGLFFSIVELVIEIQKKLLDAKSLAKMQEIHLQTVSKVYAVLYEVRLIEEGE